MGLTLGEAVQQVRREVDDWIDTSDLTGDPPSHISRLELATPVSGAIDGTNLRFRVAHYPVLEVGIEVEDQKGNPFVVDLAGTDLLRGLIKLTAAPTNPPSEEIRITYFSAFVKEADLRRFVQRGVRFVDISTTPAGDSDPLGVPEGLEQAIIEFAKSLFYEVVSTKTADFFRFAAGGKEEDKGEVPKNWNDLMKFARAEATRLRDDYYTRKGRRNVAAMGISVAPTAPYTPTR